MSIENRKHAIEMQRIITLVIITVTQKDRMDTRYHGIQILDLYVPLVSVWACYLGFLTFCLFFSVCKT